MSDGATLRAALYAFPPFPKEDAGLWGEWSVLPPTIDGVIRSRLTITAPATFISSIFMAHNNGKKVTFVPFLSPIHSYYSNMNNEDVFRAAQMVSSKKDIALEVDEIHAVYLASLLAQKRTEFCSAGGSISLRLLPFLQNFGSNLNQNFANYFQKNL